MDEQLEALLAFFKALADANRLKIIGLLSQQPYSVEELAALLGLSASTVSHHLAKLSEIGLVSAKAEGYYSVYRFEAETLEKMARSLLAKETLPTVVKGIDKDAYDRKVLKDYLREDGRIKKLPSQYKKLQAILRYVIDAFEKDHIYTEKEVNEIIVRYHEDTSGLRRDLISEHLLDRHADGSAYWRV